MCIIFVCHAHHPRYRLVIASNREEVFSRATEPLHRWPDAPSILAGRDAVAKGTWLGLDVVSGRWGGLTNVHKPGPRKVPGEGRSRGEIVDRWLKFPASNGAAEQFLAELKRDGPEYEGFNVIFGSVGEEPTSAHFFTNQGADGGEAESALAPNALYGLSNATLETPWPKLVHGKRQIEELLTRIPATGEASDAEEDRLVEDLLTLLWDDSEHEGEGYYGVGARAIRYILPGIDYGTRASTVVLARRDGTVRYVERSLGRDGNEIGRRVHAVQLGKI
ncbi:NRDE protein-domain-containing protein [Hyaloraphidium curvatum]|nr:NRDE protein-domain-containing protein [Hyaloraphidium curvatum]